MKILIVDYSGHPFQVQLSRELARRGHDVTHVYSAAFQTPKGNLIRQSDDPAGFAVVPVNTAAPFAKHTFLRRRQQEIEIGERIADLIAKLVPDVVISSNAPLDTQRVLQAAALAHGARFVFWLQDIYSAAISKVIPRKIPVLGHAIAAWYRRLEFALLRRSDAVVAITADFAPLLVARGVAADRIRVIENWAPINELPRLARDNAWAAAHMPADGLRVVYSGTLGYKHNPALLIEMARRRPDVHVMIFSEGPVADATAATAKAEGLANVHVRPWVPFADLPSMLSAADVFVAVIEPEAGVYSVPSKILTYLAIGRPILALVPVENLASRLILRHEAGFAAPAVHAPDLLAALDRLVQDADLRHRLGDSGRAYALQAFDITAIGDRFAATLG